ncbi:type II toxin-antitoxin system VapC family toxin [Candidatus Woesearchaeota archaeon]|nr:type II toxin-antitoxin system VapC family toxin [Candidatus Woesearchaeota archaeon]
MKVVDSTFLIDLLRGRKEVLKVIDSKEPLLTTQINMYEVIRGLFLKDTPSSKLIQAIEMLENIKILPLDDNSIIKSAEISSDLIKKGSIISDCDCLTAGIALSKGVNRIITRNAKHFERIKGIKVENY